MESRRVRTFKLWKKSSLTLLCLCILVSGIGLFASCALPRMDFSFDQVGDNGDDGGGAGGAGGGETGGGGGGGVVEPAQVTLEWDSNTEPDLDGYKVYYGTTVGSYEFVVDVGIQTVYTVTGLDRGETYFFAATAYNIYDVESAYSSEISCEIPL